MSTKKSNSPLTIHQKLKKMRQALGFSCQKLADMSGYSLTGVQNYEKDRDPPFQFLLFCYEKLNVRANYFLDKTDDVIFKGDEEVDQEIVLNYQEMRTELHRLKDDFDKFKEDLKNKS